MKLAFISDIHANLPALQAVMKDIMQHQPDDIYCLGDLVNFAGWDNEVIDLVKKHGISCVLGNHDEGIGYNKTQFRFSYNSEAQFEFGLQSIKKVNETITEANRRFLRSLPFSIQLQFHFPFYHFRMTLVHGSPVSNEDYVRQSMDDYSLLELLDEANADILVMGHTHIPFKKEIYTEEENRKLYKHIINAGSVGKPKQGDNKPCYVILSIDERFEMANPGTVQAQIHYVEYNTEEVIQHIKELGLPGAYNDFLRTGY